MSGLGEVLALAKRAGVASPMREFPATFLGSSEITLSELAMAYTGFPNGGWRPSAPFVLTKIEDADGEVLFQAKVRPRVRIVDEAPAYQVHATLADNLRTGAASRFGLKPMAAGGKSGTAYNFTDALFAGYNSEVTCVVWTGFDKPSPIYRGAFGSQLALPVWAKMMNAAVDYLPVHEIRKPSNLKKVEICERSGDLATDQCYETIDGERHRTTFTTFLTTAQMPKVSCPVHTGGRAQPVGDDDDHAVGGACRGAGHGRQKCAESGCRWSTWEASSPCRCARRRWWTARRKETLTTPCSPSIAAGGDLPKGNGPDPASAGQPVPTPTPEKEVRGAQHVQPAEQEVTNMLPVKVDPPDTLQFN